MPDHRTIFLQEQAYGTLFSLTNKIQTEGDRALGSLTTRQFMALVALVHLKPEESTLNNIASKLSTSKQNSKQLVSALEHKGIVRTVPSPQDRRAVNVLLTDQGKTELMEGGLRGRDLLDRLFRGFTEAEMETLWELLKKLYRFDGRDQDGFEEEMHFGSKP